MRVSLILHPLQWLPSFALFSLAHCGRTELVVQRPISRCVAAPGGSIPTRIALRTARPGRATRRGRPIFRRDNPRRNAAVSRALGPRDRARRPRTARGAAVRRSTARRRVRCRVRRPFIDRRSDGDEHRRRPRVARLGVRGTRAVGARCAPARRHDPGRARRSFAAQHALVRAPLRPRRAVLSAAARANEPALLDARSLSLPRVALRHARLRLRSRLHRPSVRAIRSRARAERDAARPSAHLRDVAAVRGRVATDLVPVEPVGSTRRALERRSRRLRRRSPAHALGAAARGPIRLRDRRAVRSRRRIRLCGCPPARGLRRSRPRHDRQCRRRSHPAARADHRARRHPAGPLRAHAVRARDLLVRDGERERAHPHHARSRGRARHLAGMDQHHAEPLWR